MPFPSDDLTISTRKQTKKCDGRQAMFFFVHGETQRLVYMFAYCVFCISDHGLRLRGWWWSDTRAKRGGELGFHKRTYTHAGARRIKRTGRSYNGWEWYWVWEEGQRKGRRKERVGDGKKEAREGGVSSVHLPSFAYIKTSSMQSINTRLQMQCLRRHHEKGIVDSILEYAGSPGPRNEIKKGPGPFRSLRRHGVHTLTK